MILKSIIKRKLERNYNLKVLDRLCLYVNAGYPFEHICSRLRLNVKNLNEYLLTIDDDSNELLSLMDSITLLKFYEWKQRLNNKLKKEYLLKGLYPSILLFIYMGLIVVYKLNFLPKIVELLGESSVHSISIRTLSFKADLHLFNLVIILLIVVVTSYILKSKDLRVLLFVRCHTLKLYQTVKTYWSFSFILYYLSLYRNGLDSTTIYEVLRRIKTPLPVQWLNSQLEHTYLNGRAWELDYFDEFLVFTVEQSSTKNQLINQLETYLNNSITVLNKKFGRCILIMKGVIIFWIIILISMYYQSLYLPLQILQTL